MFASHAVTTSASAGGGWVSTIRPGAAASTTIRGRTIGTIISGHSAGFEDAARREVFGERVNEQFFAACHQPPYAPEGGDAGVRLRDAGRRLWPCPQRAAARAF